MRPALAQNVPSAVENMMAGAIPIANNLPGWIDHCSRTAPNRRRLAFTHYVKPISQYGQGNQAAGFRTRLVPRTIQRPQSHLRQSVSRPAGASRRGEEHEFLRGTLGPAW